MTHKSGPCHRTAPAGDESDAPGSRGLCLTSTRQGLCLPYKWTPAPCGVLGPVALVIKYLWSTLYFHRFHSTSLTDPSFPCKVTACPHHLEDQLCGGGGEGGEGLRDLHTPQRRPRIRPHAPGFLSHGACWFPGVTWSYRSCPPPAPEGSQAQVSDVTNICPSREGEQVGGQLFLTLPFHNLQEVCRQGGRDGQTALPVVCEWNSHGDL